MKNVFFALLSILTFVCHSSNDADDANNVFYGDGSLLDGHANWFNTILGFNSCDVMTNSSYNSFVGLGSANQTFGLTNCIGIGSYTFSNSSNCFNCIGIGDSSMQFKNNLTNAVQIGNVLSAYDDNTSIKTPNGLDVIRREGDNLILSAPLVYIDGDRTLVSGKLQAKIKDGSFIGVRREDLREYIEPDEHYPTEMKSYPLKYSETEYGDFMFYSWPNYSVDPETVATNDYNYFTYHVYKTYGLSERLWTQLPTIEAYPTNLYGTVNWNRIYYGLNGPSYDGGSRRCKFYLDVDSINPSYIVIACKMEVKKIWSSVYEETIASHTDKYILRHTNYKPIYDVQNTVDIDNSEKSLATTSYVCARTPELKIENGSISVYTNGVKVGTLSISH